MNTAFNLEQFLKQATPVEDKYTRTPNYLVDKGYVSEMTGSALKCYVVINRFTDGFVVQTGQLLLASFKKNRY